MDKSNKNKDKIEVLGKLQAWNHAIKLSDGTWTTDPNRPSLGKNLPKWDRIKPILERLSLNNKSILDVGCNEGFFSLMAEKLGAQYVKGIDADSLRIDKANFCKEELEVKNIEFEVANIYDKIFMDNLDKYDLVLCFGFLHRIPDLFKFLSIFSKFGDTILFEWKGYTKYRSLSPLIELDGRYSVPGDEYSRGYYRPSFGAVQKLINEHGFNYHLTFNDPVQNRLIMLSSKKWDNIFGDKKFMEKTNKSSLLIKYSKDYLRNIYHILKNEIIH